MLIIGSNSNCYARTIYMLGVHIFDVGDNSNTSIQLKVCGVNHTCTVLV